RATAARAGAQLRPVWPGERLTANGATPGSRPRAPAQLRKGHRCGREGGARGGTRGSPTASADGLRHLPRLPHRHEVRGAFRDADDRDGPADGNVAGRRVGRRSGEQRLVAELLDLRLDRLRVRRARALNGERVHLDAAVPGDRVERVRWELVHVLLVLL